MILIVLIIVFQVLAEQVSEEDLAVGRVFPPLGEIRPVSLSIAERIAAYAYENGYALRVPPPADLKEHISSCMFQPVYQNAMPSMYDWPEGTHRNAGQDLYAF